MSVQASGQGVKCITIGVSTRFTAWIAFSLQLLYDDSHHTQTVQKSSKWGWGMRYEVIVTKEPNDGYTARPVIFPQMVVSGDDEAETLERVAAALVKMQANSRLVSIDVPATSPDTTDDPWATFAGMWAGEPAWEEFLAGIETYRAEIESGSQPIGDLTPDE